MINKRLHLKELQVTWYQRLADDGFEDVEKSKKFYHLLNLYKQERESREEYFRILGHLVNDESTQFRNHIDHLIMSRYAEGTRLTNIIVDLHEVDILLDVKTVRMIIRRYEKKWQIKNYTRKQLHLKPKLAIR